MLHAVRRYVWSGLLDFQGVESFAVNTDDRALRDKCIGVDAFDQTEDIEGLTLLGQHHQDFRFIFAIPAGAVEYGNTAPCFADDAIGNLFVLL